MRPDLIKCLIIIAACAALGSAFGYGAEFGVLGAILSNIWLLRRAKKLHQWIFNPDDIPDSEEGIFYLLHRDLRDLFYKNKQQKRELHKTLQKFREASSVLPDAVVVFDKTSTISWTNKLANTLLGISSKRDHGQRITNILRNPIFVNALDKHEIEPLNIDIPAPQQAGHMINLKIVDLSQNTRMLVARDITRLTDINKAQKDFVSNVSHELKTPLTVMRGYLEMIDGHKDVSPTLSKPISDMHSQTCRMQKIIEELLYLAKLEGQVGANITDSHETISIQNIMNMIMDSTQAIAVKNNQTITSEIDETLCIKGNISELQIAFNNLVTNALRYTPENGKILIQWHKRNNCAVFSVKDNGIGISPNHIDRITERFYRVDKGRSSEKGGTGLGLAIVKNVLNHHQASLSIDSQLGAGSKFECIFPLNNS